MTEHARPVTCGDDCGYTKFAVFVERGCTFWRVPGALNDVATFDVVKKLNTKGHCPKCGRPLGFDEQGNPTVGASYAELEKQYARYRLALIEAGGFMWQEMGALLPPDDFDEDIGGEGSWFLKFLRDADAETRDWWEPHLNCRYLQKAEELSLRGIRCTCRGKADICEYCVEMRKVSDAIDALPEPEAQP